MGAMSKSQTYALAWTIVWAAAMAILVLASIHLADGRLIYTIDDPYIHLSVAENIVGGGYGVNAEEFSSPASSVLYPLILALTIVLGLGTLGPLVVNVLAAGLSVWLLLEFFWRQAVPEDATERPLYINMMAPLLILSISAFALPMTGMEHTLHVLTVIVAIRGLVAVLEDGKVSVWFVIAVIAMPFVRFEGVALATAVALALTIAGRWRIGILIAVPIVAGFGVYAVVMQRLGLPFLPSSVLVKSQLAVDIEGGSAIVVFTGLVRDSLLSIFGRWGVVLGLAVCALFAVAQDREGKWRSLKSPELLCALVMLFGLGGHIVAGSYGAFFRYEVYAVALLIIGGIFLLRPVLQYIHRKYLIAAQMGLVAAMLILVAPFDTATMHSARASRNIYEQQFQMHRFATEFFPRRVAVNDLGWVSYDNDNFVLDLWGLSSEKSRKLRMSGRLDANAIQNLAEEADVDFAMIFQSWFPGRIPDSWCLMAVMETEQVVADSVYVHFFATNASAQADMSAALDRFGAALPERVRLRRASCASPDKT